MRPLRTLLAVIAGQLAFTSAPAQRSEQLIACNLLLSAATELAKSKTIADRAQILPLYASFVAMEKRIPAADVKAYNDLKELWTQSTKSKHSILSFAPRDGVRIASSGTVSLFTVSLVIKVDRSWISQSDRGTGPGGWNRYELPPSLRFDKTDLTNYSDQVRRIPPLEDLIHEKFTERIRESVDSQSMPEVRREVDVNRLPGSIRNIPSAPLSPSGGKN